MAGSQCLLLQLPPELRLEIYEFYYCCVSESSLLYANKQLQGKGTDFLRKNQHTFTYNITAQAAEFDDFAQWCFMVKSHTPRLGRMKHIILNVYPPDLDRPHEFYQIWKSASQFCKELGSQRRIPRLTINFLETDRAKWAVGGIAKASMALFPEDDFPHYDVEQILVTLARFIANIEAPRITLPRTYMGVYHDGRTAQQWIE